MRAGMEAVRGAQSVANTSRHDQKMWGSAAAAQRLCSPPYGLLACRPWSSDEGMGSHWPYNSTNPS